jgi:HD-like signal output (HDOD) protein
LNSGKLTSGETAIVIRTTDAGDIQVKPMPSQTNPSPSVISIKREDISGISAKTNPLHTTGRMLGTGPTKIELKQAKKAVANIELPAISTVLIKIRDELQQSTPNIKTISDLVKGDAALYGHLIKIVNSPFFNLEAEVTSVQQAIVILGLNKFTKLVESSSLVSAVGNIEPLMSSYWEEGKVMALCSAGIAKHIVGIDMETAYMAGLFCTIGGLYLARKHIDYLEKVSDLSTTNPYSSVDFENQYFRTNHSDISYLMAKFWHAPDIICDAIYHHHNPNLPNISDKSIRTYAAILALSSHLVERVWHIIDRETPEREALYTLSVKELLISDDAIEEIVQDVVLDLEKTK